MGHGEIDLRPRTGDTFVFAGVGFERDDLSTISKRQSGAALPRRALASISTGCLASSRRAFHSREATSASVYRNCTAQHLIGGVL